MQMEKRLITPTGMPGWRERETLHKGVGDFGAILLSLTPANALHCGTGSCAEIIRVLGQRICNHDWAVHTANMNGMVSVITRIHAPVHAFSTLGSLHALHAEADGT